MIDLLDACLLAAPFAGGYLGWLWGGRKARQMLPQLEAQAEDVEDLERVIARREERIRQLERRVDELEAGEWIT